MIIKSMSRKDPSFAQLTAYMLAPERAEVAVAHNLPIGTQAEAEIVRAFDENHAALPGRVNGNALYHEILALAPDTDLPKREQIAALTKIAQRYLDRRAPQQLAVGVVHAETAHIHMHVMISSNAVLSSKREWLTKKDFADIQREIENYRVKQFPELGTTRLFDKQPDRSQPSVREAAARLRTGQPSHKKRLAADLRIILNAARRRDALDAELAKQGLTLYQRGRSVGVMTDNGRRYRFKTLGLADVYADAMARIELVESRTADLKRTQSRLSKQLSREC